MRRLLCMVTTTAILGLAGSAFAQAPASPARSTSLVQFSVVVDRPSGEAYSSKRQSMFGVLGAWSLASMGAGAGLAFGGPSDFERFVGIQALAWGTVDLVFAAVGLAQSRTSLFTTPDSAEVVTKDTASLSRAFWINALLDVGYVIVGTLLWNLGGTDAIRGTGAGIVTQGGFLFGFDTIGYMVFR